MNLYEAHKQNAAPTAQQRRKNMSHKGKHKDRGSRKRYLRGLHLFHMS